MITAINPPAGKERYPSSLWTLTCLLAIPIQSHFLQSDFKNTTCNYQPVQKLLEYDASAGFSNKLVHNVSCSSNQTNQIADAWIHKNLWTNQKADYYNRLWTNFLITIFEERHCLWYSNAIYDILSQFMIFQHCFMIFQHSLWYSNTVLWYSNVHDKDCLGLKKWNASRSKFDWCYMMWI